MCSLVFSSNSFSWHFFSLPVSWTLFLCLIYNRLVSGKDLEYRMMKKAWSLNTCLLAQRAFHWNTFIFHLHFYLWKVMRIGAGEITRWLIAFSAVATDLGLLLAPTWRLSTIYNSSPQGSDTLSSLCRYWMQVACRCTCRQQHPCTYSV